MASAPTKDQDRVLNQLTKAINKRTKKQNKSRKTIKVASGVNYWAKLKTGGKLARELKKQGSERSGTLKKGLAGIVKAAATLAKANSVKKDVANDQSTAVPVKSSPVSDRDIGDILEEFDALKAEMGEIKSMLSRISQFHGLGHGTRRKTLYVPEEETIQEEFVEEDSMKVLDLEGEDDVQ